MGDISTSSSEVDNLLQWLRDELQRTQYGKVGLLFTVHEGKIVALEKTVSIRGKFVLNLNGGD